MEEEAIYGDFSIEMHSEYPTTNHHSSGTAHTSTSTGGATESEPHNNEQPCVPDDRGQSQQGRPGGC